MGISSKSLVISPSLGQISQLGDFHLDLTVNYDTWRKTSKISTFYELSEIPCVLFDGVYYGYKAVVNKNVKLAILTVESIFIPFEILEEVISRQLKNQGLNLLTEETPLILAKLLSKKQLNFHDVEKVYMPGVYPHVIPASKFSSKQQRKFIPSIEMLKDSRFLFKHGEWSDTEDSLGNVYQDDKIILIYH